MGRMYSVEFAAVAVTAAQDLFSILPAANKPCLIHGLFLSQSSDVADAAEEIVEIKLVIGNTTVGSGGSAPTPRPLDKNDAAAGFTARANDTTEVSAGTAIDHWSHAWNIRVPLEYWWTPECRSRVQNADFAAVQLISVPADSLTVSGTLYVEEL